MHGHHAQSRRPERKHLAATLAITVSIMVLEAVGGWVSGSLALLSDAAHMLTDTIALGLSLVAIQMASRPADRRRTYGYQRLEILAALANGVLLLMIAIFIAIEAVERVRHPAPLHWQLTMGVAAIGLMANLLGLLLLRGAKSLNVRGARMHILGDAAASIAVIIGAAVIAATGQYVVDAILSLGIAGLIVYGSWRLLRDATDVLLESCPAGIDAGQVASDIVSVAGISTVHDLHIWAITDGQPSLSAHLVVEKSQSESPDAILTRVNALLAERWKIHHTTLQVESEAFEHTGTIH